MVATSAALSAALVGSPSRSVTSVPSFILKSSIVLMGTDQEFQAERSDDQSRPEDLNQAVQYQGWSPAHRTTTDGRRGRSPSQYRPGSQLERLRAKAMASPLCTSTSSGGGGGMDRETSIRGNSEERFLLGHRLPGSITRALRSSFPPAHT